MRAAPSTGQLMGSAGQRPGYATSSASPRSNKTPEIQTGCLSYPLKGRHAGLFEADKQMDGRTNRQMLTKPSVVLQGS